MRDRRPVVSNARQENNPRLWHHEPNLLTARVSSAIHRYHQQPVLPGRSAHALALGHGLWRGVRVDYGTFEQQAGATIRGTPADGHRTAARPYEAGESTTRSGTWLSGAVGRVEYGIRPDVRLERTVSVGIDLKARPPSRGSRPAGSRLPVRLQSWTSSSV